MCYKLNLYTALVLLTLNYFHNLDRHVSLISIACKHTPGKKANNSCRVSRNLVFIEGGYPTNIEPHLYLPTQLHYPSYRNMK